MLMFEKIQAWTKSAVSKVAEYHVRGAPRLLIYAIISLVFLLISLFIAGWSWQWYASAKIDLPILIQMVNTLTSASAIAAIGFFGRALIDEDEDGIPDEFQREKGGGLSGTGNPQGGFRGR